MAFWDTKCTASPHTNLCLNAKSHYHPDIYRRPDGFLGHKVYRKSTHTNPCLNTKSHHHPDIYRRPDGSLGHKVYRKPTHNNLYHNAKSHHHPSNKQAVLSTLIHRARSLCDEDSLQAELVFLRDVFKQNGYNDGQIHRALNYPHFSVRSKNTKD
jgi:hypothetical protein